MNRIVTIATAAVLLAGSVSLASAERYEPAASTYGTQIDVTAGSFLNSKELAHRGLSANDTINVTVAPAGVADNGRSSNH